MSRTRCRASCSNGTVTLVIHEVDVALRALIEREATAGTEVEVAFDAPTKDWAGRRNVPTIDVYLYDIREDLRRRERGLINQYDGDRIAARHLPPRHFKLSYLVTAWTQRPGGRAPTAVRAAVLLPAARRDPDGSAHRTARRTRPAGAGDSGACRRPEDRSFADVWSALGGELKPSLDVVVSAPTDTGQQYVSGPAGDGTGCDHDGRHRRTAAGGRRGTGRRRRVPRAAAAGGAARSGQPESTPAADRAPGPDVLHGMRANGRCRAEAAPAPRRRRRAQAGRRRRHQGGIEPAVSDQGLEYLLRRVGLVEDRIRALVRTGARTTPHPTIRSAGST